MANSGVASAEIVADSVLGAVDRFHEGEATDDTAVLVIRAG